MSKTECTIEGLERVPRHANLILAAIAAFREESEHLRNTRALDRALAAEQSLSFAFRRDVAIASLAIRS